MELKRAVAKDMDLMSQVEASASDTRDFHLWWLGQSGYLLSWRGKRLLIDPYLSDSLTKKYVGSDKPHVRMSERVIDPQLLSNISVVSSSHNHTDHLDAETLRAVFKNNPSARFVIPRANTALASERADVPADFPLKINAGESVTVDAFTFHGIPAKHNEIDRDEDGNCRYMGYVITFGDYSIYHSGDTLWFDGMVDLLRPFRIDVALLPINGNDPSRGVAGNLNSREAAELGKQVGAKTVIPCHYDMFTFNTADPQTFAREAMRIGQRYVILEPGGHFSSRSL